MKLIRSGRVLPDPQWHLESHSHIDNEIIIVLQGKLHITAADGTRQTRCAGEAVLHPRHWRHEEDSDPREPVETIFLAFTGDMGDRSVWVNDRDGKLRLLAKWLLEAKLSTSKRIDVLIDAYFKAIIEEFRQHLAMPAPDDLVGLTRAYCLEHLGEHLTVEILAAQSGMSKFHFIRTYRALCGRTPMRDLRQLRIERAKELLMMTRLPLKKIAHIVGFIGESQLSHVFTKMEGGGAGRYRRRTRNRPAAG